MNKTYEQRLQTLAEHLVTPERYGKIVLAEVVQLPSQLTLDYWDGLPDGA